MQVAFSIQEIAPVALRKACRRGKDVAALVFFSVVGPGLKDKLKGLEPRRKADVSKIRKAFTIHDLGFKCDSDTDIEEVDPQDKRMKFFRRKRYWSNLGGWESFLRGE